MNNSVEKVFDSYSIDSHEPLTGLKRTKCSKCGASRMYFCYKCHIYTKGIDTTLVPRLKLPFKIDIIKHMKEVDGKSTAIHAVLLAPEDVKIYTYPMIPDYSKEAAILVFPNKNSLCLKDFFDCLIKAGAKRNADEDLLLPENKKRKLNSSAEGNGPCNKCPAKLPRFKFDKAVFVDSTWNQCYSIVSDERLANLKTVRLHERKTVYWRHNTDDMPDTYLATIEAIHSFLVSAHKLMYDAYDGEYDNLLYFYSYFYKVVHRSKSTQDKASEQSRSSEMLINFCFKRSVRPLFTSLLENQNMLEPWNNPCKRIFTTRSEPKQLSMPKGDHENFVLIYKFTYIRAAAMLSRLKIAQTTFFCISSTFACCMAHLDYLPWKDALVLSGAAGLGVIVLFLISHFCRRLIGLIWIDNERSFVKIAYLNFWGSRKDKTLPIVSIAELSEVNQDPENIFLRMQLRDSSEFFYFTFLGGHVLHKKHFSYVFGKTPSPKQ